MVPQLDFVKNHQLRELTTRNYMKLISGAQVSARFFKSHWDKDDEWAIVIDELNQQLHVRQYQIMIQ